MSLVYVSKVGVGNNSCVSVDFGDVMVLCIGFCGCEELGGGLVVIF